jgi:CubicO group peptidase (beta-lactamase class C family)
MEIPNYSLQLIWRHRHFFIFIFLLVFLLNVGAQQANTPPLDKRERIKLLNESLDKILIQLHSKQGPGMAVWVEFEGEVIYSNWAGLAQRDKRIPIDGNTSFELASASKPLTAALAFQLAENGLLNLDDSVTQWLPDLPPAWKSISVRHLLTQTAGVPDYMSQINAAKLLALDGLTNEKLMQRWNANTRLNFEPGSNVEYSNSNYVLLAEVISKACSASFGQCLRQRMFEPLGMANSRVESEAALDTESLALNYATTKHTKGIQLRTEGPTGIYSSVKDVAVWLRAYQDGKIVTTNGKALMTVPASLKPIFENGERYGMGWVLPSVDSPAGSFAHAGQKDGYRTLIRANPSRRISYIILSNGGDFVQPASNEIQYWIQELLEQSP